MELFGIKLDKAVFYFFALLAVLCVVVPAMTFMGAQGKYAELTKSNQGSLFRNVLLSTANEEAKYLWTEQGVYDFIQSLSRYNFTNAVIGNPTKEDVSLPDGRTLSVEVISVKLGAIMPLSDFFDLINTIEKQQKLVYIYPTSANNLNDYKEIDIKFYIAPKNLPKPDNYPVSVQFKKYGLDAMFAQKEDINEKGITVPVFYGKRLWYGIFEEGENTPIYLLVH